MQGELFWLALSAGLLLIIWIPYTAQYGGIVGLKSGTTDVPPVDKLPEWAKRCNRAHMNLIETLVPFAVLIVVLNLSGKADASTVTAAAIFFFARLAHIGIYIMGIPYLRTVAFSISWLVCLFLLWQVVI